MRVSDKELSRILQQDGYEAHDGYYDDGNGRAIVTPEPKRTERDFMRIAINGHKAVSWNKLYSQQHWSKRSRLKNEMRQLVRAALPEDYWMFKRPVNISIHGYFRTKPLDSDNICAKLYIDALKGHVLIDDDIRYVRSVTVQAAKWDTDSVVILVEAV